MFAAAIKRLWLVFCCVWFSVIVSLAIYDDVPSRFPIALAIAIFPPVAVLALKRLVVFALSGVWR